MAKREAFISLKDHKENFQNNPTCRLSNPAKSESGKISKVILDRINATLRSACNVNQWRNSYTVIEWFNNIKDKSKHTFLSFDIVDFYPSISEDLLDKAISWAREVTPISEQEVTIIKHARKSTLFNKEKPWIKKSDHGTFDVTMGSYDGAEVCELIGLFILNELSKRFGKVNVGLYRDDGLVLLKNCTGRLADKARKDLHKIFDQVGLRITAQTNQQAVNFLDVTFDLHNGKHQPYRKPNDEPQYISNHSNHPPTILKHLPSAVSKRISLLSSDDASFESAAPLYNDALKRSHFNETVHYTSEETTRSSPSQKRRKRNIIWFNPPFSRNVRTNIGRNFLQLVDKHFPPSNALHKIFNRNTIKISYTCMDNMKSTIMKHNARILSNSNRPRETDDKCNCRKKEECPLDGKCLTSSLVYKAIVTTTDDGQSKQYIGMTANTFKERYRNHTKSFQHKKHSNETELSKHVWELKNKNRLFKIDWSVTKRAAAYRSGGKRCNLCLEEKLYIMKANKQTLLNKRSELVSKCRHQNRFSITNSRRAKKKVMTHKASHTP